jgi:hypothetical protein
LGCKFRMHLVVLPKPVHHLVFGHMTAWKFEKEEQTTPAVLVVGSCINGQTGRA